MWSSSELKSWKCIRWWFYNRKYSAAIWAQSNSRPFSSLPWLPFPCCRFACACSVLCGGHTVFVVWFGLKARKEFSAQITVWLQKSCVSGTEWTVDKKKGKNPAVVNAPCSSWHETKAAVLSWIKTLQMLDILLDIFTGLIENFWRIWLLAYLLFMPSYKLSYSLIDF